MRFIITTLLSLFISLTMVRAQFTFALPEDQPFGLEEYGSVVIRPSFIHTFVDLDQDGLKDCLYVGFPLSDSTSRLFYVRNEGAAFPVYGMPQNVNWEEFTFSLNYIYGMNTSLVDVDGDGWPEFTRYYQEISADYDNAYIYFNKTEPGSFFPFNNIGWSDYKSLAGGGYSDDGYTYTFFENMDQITFPDLYGDDLAEMIMLNTYTYSEYPDSIYREFMFQCYEHAPGEQWPRVFGITRNNPQWLESLRFTLNQSQLFLPYYTKIYSGDLDGDNDDDLLLNLARWEDDRPIFSLYTVENKIAEDEEFSGNLNLIWLDSLFFEVDIIDLDMDGDADVLVNQVGYLTTNLPFLTHNQLVYLENTTVNTTSAFSEERLKFSIYPNPALNATTIQLDGNQDGPVILDVFDLRGKLIRSEWIYSSTHQLLKNDFGRGMFSVQLRSSSRKGSRMLIFF